MTRPVLRLTQNQLDSIVAQARAQAEVEVCGLLGGQGDSVWGVYPVRNSSPTLAVRFLMADQSFVEAMMDIDGRGWEIVGIYHSHPAGYRSEPSPTDIAEANCPEALHLIVSFDREGQLTVGVFQIADGRVREGVLEIVAEGS